jgi:copper oxidase (laccase) domain-containing protein
MPMTQAPYYLKEINDASEVRADFIGRVAGVSVDTDRKATVDRLQPAHESAVHALGFTWSQLHRAEQVHGVDIAIVGKDAPAQTWPDVDGLITADAGVLLGIYVADCGAVYISDPVRGVIALLHSGKKGTEGNITGKAIAMMQEQWGSRPEDLIVALAPCIRPPAYEVDFAAEIRRQVLASGVPENQWTDSGACTSENLENYYSYRVEKGNTGRMLALLGRMAS